MPETAVMTATNDPLVSTEWLAAHLNDANVKVVDATFKLPGVLPLPKDDYLAAHLPGAVFFDVDAVSDHSNPLPHMFPSAEQFGRDVGHLGIGNGDTVVVYDSGGWVAAPRAWWMFLSYGHSNVRVLNGGLKKWRAEGRPVQSGEVKAKPASFRATYDAKRVRSLEQMVANVGSKAEQVIDARAAERFEGRAPEPRPGIRSGHIPGSRNVPYNQLFDAATGAMKPLEDLRKAFIGAGVKLDAPIVTSCGSGVSAGVLTLALYRLGVGMGTGERAAGRDRSGLIEARPLRLNRRGRLTRRGGQGRRRERIGRLLLGQGLLPRDPRAQCRPAARLGACLGSPLRLGTSLGLVAGFLLRWRVFDLNCGTV
jgi:thiosulfate/3-mercaptopyruvate sulfurtransferase